MHSACRKKARASLDVLAECAPSLAPAGLCCWGCLQHLRHTKIAKTVPWFKISFRRCGFVLMSLCCRRQRPRCQECFFVLFVRVFLFSRVSDDDADLAPSAERPFLLSCGHLADLLWWLPAEDRVESWLRVSFFFKHHFQLRRIHEPIA